MTIPEIRVEELMYRLKRGEDISSALLQNRDNIDVDYQDEEGKTLLFVATQNEQKQVIENLVRLKADINKAANDGFTPVHVAAYHGDIAIIQVLDKLGAELNLKDQNGLTPTEIAQSRGHDLVMRFLDEKLASTQVSEQELINRIRRGEDISSALIENRDNIDLDYQDEKGKTLLFFAAEYGQENTIMLLAHLGADLNKTNQNGLTPFHAAAFKGHVAIISLLDTLGAKSNIKGRNGLTPISVAEKKGHKEVIKLLKERRETRKHNTQQLIDRLRGNQDISSDLLENRDNIDVDYQDENGRTLIYFATQNRDIELIRILENLGADLNIVDKYGSTPYWIAKQDKYAKKNGHNEVLAFFNEKLNSTRLSEQELMYRLERGEDISNLLWQNRDNIDVNYQNGKGRTLLFIAAENGQAKIIKILAHLGADLNKSDKRKSTPLDAAALNGNVEVIKILDNLGAKLNLKTLSGETHAAVAKRAGYREVMEFFEEKENLRQVIAKKIMDDLKRNKDSFSVFLEQVDINYQDQEGRTLIHFAAQNADIESIKTLAHLGADLNIVDKDGSTPYWIALKSTKYKSSFEIRKFLSKELIDKRVSEQELIKLLYKGEDISTLLWQNRHSIDFDYLGYSESISLLNAAAKTGNIEVIKILRKIGGLRRTDYAMVIAIKNLHIEVIKLLDSISGNADDYRTSDRRNMLHIGAENGNADMVQFGLELKNHSYSSRSTAMGGGATIKSNFPLQRHLTRADFNGITPVHIAAEKGYINVLKVIKDKDNDLFYRKNRSGATPAYIAAENGRTEVLRFLVRKNVDVNISDLRGRSPIYMAAKNGHLETLRFLLAKGAKINYTIGKYFKPPLHIAAANGHVEVVKLLVEAGAHPDQKDKNGYTPAQMAIISGHLKVIEELNSLGANVNKAFSIKNYPLITTIKKEIKQCLNNIKDDKNAMKSKIKSLSEEGKYKEIAQLCFSKEKNKNPLILFYDNKEIKHLVLESLRKEAENFEINGLMQVIFDQIMTLEMQNKLSEFSKNITKDNAKFVFSIIRPLGQQGIALSKNLAVHYNRQFLFNQIPRNDYNAASEEYANIIAEVPEIPIAEVEFVEFAGPVDVPTENIEIGNVRNDLILDDLYDIQRRELNIRLLAENGIFAGSDRPHSSETAFKIIDQDTFHRLAIAMTEAQKARINASNESAKLTIDSLNEMITLILDHTQPLPSDENTMGSTISHHVNLAALKKRLAVPTDDKKISSEESKQSETNSTSNSDSQSNPELLTPSSESNTAPRKLGARERNKIRERERLIRSRTNRLPTETGDRQTTNDSATTDLYFPDAPTHVPLPNTPNTSMETRYRTEEPTINSTVERVIR